MSKIYMVFDVESVGLHGEGFAVGFVVIDQAGAELDSGKYACASIICRGSESGHAWVQANVPDFAVNNETAWQVRSQFWQKWQQWKPKALLFADCCWPVEARFLAACVDDDPLNREWEGPYPLHDIATVLLAAGLDPLAKRERRPNELPEHDPLCDARQSARLLVDTLGKL